MRIAQIGVSAKTHAKAEESVSKIFGSTSQASILKTRTTYKNNSLEQPFYFGQDQVKALFNILEKSNKKFRKILSNMQELSFMYLRAILNNATNKGRCIYENIINYRVNTKEENNIIKTIIDTLCEEEVLGEALLLMTIPRIYMILSATRDKTEFLTMQPIRSDYYRLTVEVRLRTPKPKNLNAHLTALGIASLILAPQILGLGKATSRGLGRFTLEKYEEGKDLDSRLGDYANIMRNILVNLIRLSQEGDIKYLKEALLAYKSLIQDQEVNYDSRMLKAPSLKGARLMWTSDPVHPCPYSVSELMYAEENNIDIKCNKDNYNKWNCNNIGDGRLRVLCILSAIGVTTLKSTWKKYNGDRIVESGVRYHTWVLGLPRGVLNKKKGRIRNVTGYHKFVRSGRIEKFKFNEELDSNVLKLRELSKILGTTIRNQSPFIIYPLPNNGLIVMALGYSSNLADILHGRNYALYHIGIHKEKHNKTNKIYHYIRVDYAAKPKASKSSHFKDKLGIARPDNDNKEHKTRYHSIDEEVYDAAVAWIRELLGIKGEWVL